MSLRFQRILDKASSKNSYSNVLFTTEELQKMQREEESAAKKLSSRGRRRCTTSQRSRPRGDGEPRIALTGKRRKSNRVGSLKLSHLYSRGENENKQGPPKCERSLSTSSETTTTSASANIPSFLEDSTHPLRKHDFAIPHPNTCIKIYKTADSGAEEGDGPKIIEDNSRIKRRSSEMGKEHPIRLTVNMMKRHSQQYDNMHGNSFNDQHDGKDSMVRCRVDSWIKDTSPLPSQHDNRDDSYSPEKGEGIKGNDNVNHGEELDCTQTKTQTFPISYYNESLVSTDVGAQHHQAREDEKRFNTPEIIINNESNNIGDIKPFKKDGGLKATEQRDFQESGEQISVESPRTELSDNHESLVGDMRDLTSSQMEKTTAVSELYNQHEFNIDNKLHSANIVTFENIDSVESKLDSAKERISGETANKRNAKRSGIRQPVEIENEETKENRNKSSSPHTEYTLKHRRYTTRRQEEVSRRLMVGTPTSPHGISLNHKQSSHGSCTIDLNPGKENMRVAKRLTLMKNLLSFTRRENNKKIPPVPSSQKQSSELTSSDEGSSGNATSTNQLKLPTNMSKEILLRRRKTLTNANNVVIPGGWEIQHQTNTFQGNRDLDELSHVSTTDSNQTSYTELYEDLKRCKYLRIPRHLRKDSQ